MIWNLFRAKLIDFVSVSKLCFIFQSGIYLTCRKWSLIPSQLSIGLGELVPHTISQLLPCSDRRQSLSSPFLQTSHTDNSQTFSHCQEDKGLSPVSLSSWWPRSLNSCCWYLNAQSLAWYDRVATRPPGYPSLLFSLSISNADSFEVFSKICQDISGWFAQMLNSKGLKTNCEQFL